MPRVKRGTIAHKKREKVLKKTKGYRWGRKSKEKAAKEALLHGLSRQFRGRKEKKRTNRQQWSVQINAAVRAASTEAGAKKPVSYSRLISALKKQKITLNRKMLADIAEHNPEVFKKIAEKAA